ncbi:hypothetical protein [Streptomyces syringium]|uniref:hypothetical protein n=1 Tax=Streptomyces syringium TaxID=76729 RepID=UPI003415B88E
MYAKNLRIAAATVMAAVALGVAAPAAGATESGQAPAAHNRTVAAAALELELTPEHARLVLQTPEVASRLTAEERAAVQALADSESSERVKRGLGSSAAKAAWAAIKKAGPSTVNAAKKAAKKGAKGLKDWANGLSWKSPIRWTIGQLPAAALEELIRYLLS